MMPAEGLLGAARLARSLRSGPPSKTPAVDLARRPSRRTVLVLCRGFDRQACARNGPFMHYDLGFFDHETGRIECAENPFSAKVTYVSGINRHPCARNGPL